MARNSADPFLAVESLRTKVRGQQAVVRVEYEVKLSALQHIHRISLPRSEIKGHLITFGRWHKCGSSAIQTLSAPEMRKLLRSLFGSKTFGTKLSPALRPSWYSCVASTCDTDGGSTVYYGKLLRQIAETLKGASSDIQQRLAGLREGIDKNTDAVNSASQSNQGQKNVKVQGLEEFLTQQNQRELSRPAQDDRNYHIQVAIAVAAWLAFFAAYYYAHVLSCNGRR